MFSRAESPGPTPPPYAGEGNRSIGGTQRSTLVLRPQDGYLLSPLDASYRSRRRPFRLGEEMRLPEVTLRITALTANGRPAELTCRYAVPLEDPSLRWLCWTDGDFHPWALPAVGETRRLPLPMPNW